jgi:hypothetical protein
LLDNPKHAQQNKNYDDEDDRPDADVHGGPPDDAVPLETASGLDGSCAP